MDNNITYRKKDKGWQCIISYKDNLGQWKQKSKQGFKTQRDAKDFINTTLKELESNTKNDSSLKSFDGTFKELSQIYLDHIVLYKEYNTVKGYHNTFSKFNKLNDKSIKSIKRHDVQNIIDDLIKEGLKTSTIQTYLRRLTVFFRYVLEDLNLIVDLPTTKIKIPKVNGETNKKALTKMELESLLLNLECNRYYIVAFIAANTGMRLGEILGLTWSDIDFKNCTVDVNKQWKLIRSKHSNFGTLKSKNSYRIIPVSLKFTKELKKYKKNNPTDLYNRVATFNIASISKYLNPKLRELAGISIHELRHTYATTLISNGVDFKTAAKILGHDVEQTMRTYSHVNDDMVKRATNIIENVF